MQPFFTTFPTNVNIACQLMCAIFSLLLFKEMLDYPLKVNITRQSVFCFNRGMLFYATTMFFNLGISNYLAGHREDLVITRLWYFDLYLFHLFILAALLAEKKEKNASSR